ncbi:MAG: carboxylesterase family protein, partial [Rhodospirillales bacterium]|nr:carboxylesterase family protein [Rhodospirillales bacterium]
MIGNFARFAFSAIACTAITVPAPARDVPNGPVVSTSLGPVRAANRDGVALFGNSPFAAPPIGEARWRAPAPATPWTSIRDASRFGPDCPQPRRPSTDHPQSEACLTLNVATPDPGARDLPVLVSIHGGAYFMGSGREIFDDAIPPIVADGVVVVSPNYRLGRLGFFAHPGLTGEAPGATANYWLMDQVAALEWVRDNIASFGGDPGNVTIIGCSAGGSSVNALMATPRARGLFARASVPSGGGLFNANRSLATAERQGIAFAGRVGVSSYGGEAIAALRRLTTEQILAGDTGAPDFGAVMDGNWLPAPISVLFARGAIAHVPLISGSTSNEASVFGLMGFDRPTLESRFGIDLAAVTADYGFPAESELIRQVQTDFIFTSAAMGMTALAARAGLPAWSYHFDYVDEARRGSVPGAAHCEDMPYWLGQQRAPTAQDAAIGATMRGFLLHYLRGGDPNAPGLPRWEATSAGTVNPLLIRPRTAMAPDFRAAQLAPWFEKWPRDSGETLGIAAARATAR